MNKLARIIDKLDQEDLEKIQKDFEEGHLQKLVRKKLDEFVVQDRNKVCPVCNSPIVEENFTLVFGPKDFRKKASFCAFDCLEYFINQLKQQQKN